MPIRSSACSKSVDILGNPETILKPTGRYHFKRFSCFNASRSSLPRKGCPSGCAVFSAIKDFPLRSQEAIKEHGHPGAAFISHNVHSHGSATASFSYKSYQSLLTADCIHWTYIYVENISSSAITYVKSFRSNTSLTLQLCKRSATYIQCQAWHLPPRSEIHCEACGCPARRRLKLSTKVGLQKANENGGSRMFEVKSLQSALRFQNKSRSHPKGVFTTRLLDQRCGFQKAQPAVGRSKPDRSKGEKAVSLVMWRDIFRPSKWKSCRKSLDVHEVDKSKQIGCELPLLLRMKESLNFLRLHEASGVWA